MSISGINSNLVSALTNIKDSSYQSGSITSKSSKSSEAAFNATKLRASAENFSNAIIRIDSVESFLELSKDTLEKLEKVVDQALVLANKATRYSTSEAQRAKLDRDFKKLGEEFTKIAKEVSIDGYDLLTEEGISGVFELAGLDKEQSRSLAKVFSTFVTTTTSDELASESIKGKPVSVPNAIQPSTPTESFTITKISSNTGGTAPTVVKSSSVNTVFVDDQDPVNQNGGSNDTAVIVSESGHSQSITFATADVEVLATSENSGYSLIRSTQDFLGYNGSGFAQLYIANEQGVVIHQVTDFSATVNIESADLSSNGGQVVFVTTADLLGTNADGSDEVYRVKSAIESFGDPSSNEVSQITGFNLNGNISNPVKIDESGTNLAFDGTGTWTADGLQIRGFALYNITGGTFDLTQRASQRRLFNFIDADTVAIYNANTNDVSTHDLNALTNTLVFQPGAGISLGTVSQNGYFAYKNSSNDILAVNIASGLTTATTLVYDSQTGDSISSISISNNASGNLKVAAAGVIANKSSLTQAYVFNENIVNTTAVTSTPDNLENIFDYSLKNRSNAFRVKSDLTALKEQIKINKSAVQEGINVLKANRELIVAVTDSFFRLSNDLNSITDASNTAKNLVKSLQQYGLSQKAMNQIENLEPIAATTLLAQA